MLKRSILLALPVVALVCFACPRSHATPSQFSDPEAYGSGIGDDDAPGVVSNPPTETLPAGTIELRTARAPGSSQTAFVNPTVRSSKLLAWARDQLAKVIAFWKPLRR